MSSVIAFIFLFYQYIVLIYFAFVNLTYALLNAFGLQAIVQSNQQLTNWQRESLLQRGVSTPISLLVAAYNEEKSIVGSVRSLLKLHYPVFEIIIASDGSTDNTLPLLIETFDMVELDFDYRMTIPCKPVHRIFRSRRYPNLTVIEKENGGKADATNAGANIARYPLVCALDADSLLDESAIVWTVQQFRLDANVIAAGGTVRPLNGAKVRNGRIQQLNAPRNILAQMQILEYSRAFFSGRTGWAAMQSLLIISGAFGIFRRDVIMEVGGWSTETVTEDIELVLRLHKHFRDQDKPYRIAFVPFPVCWTEVPSDITSLRRQRNRWHRGLIEVLWMYRDMFYNPRYGRIGFLALPYMLWVEALSPMVEIFGIFFLIFAYVTGILSPEFALVYLAIAYTLGVWLSLISLGMETLLYLRYNGMRDYLLLIGAALIEMIGYRQVLVLERFVATFQVRAKAGTWGKIKRTGF